MRYIVKNVQDSDKENAKQLELILNNKAALYNDISEALIDDIVADDADDIELAKIIEPSFSINRNQFYPRNYESRDTMELADVIIFKKDKQLKENHPHGWYRKFDKKRY